MRGFAPVISEKIVAILSANPKLRIRLVFAFTSHQFEIVLIYILWVHKTRQN